MSVRPNVDTVIQAATQLEPGQQFDFSSVTIQVYKAKDYLDPTWASDVHAIIVKECRKTFSRYGDVASIVNYDLKSAVYIARADYWVDGIPVSEWLTLRLVPAIGTPALNEDLIACTYQGTSLLQLLEASDLLKKDIDPLLQIVTVSRVCGVHPYPTRAHDENLVIRGKLQYGALLFACMMQVACAWQDTATAFRPSLITALFHKRFLDTFMRHQGTTPLVFTPARHVLGIDGDVILKRDEKSYKYPGYFLELYQLLDTLQMLIDTGVITDATVMHHTKSDIPLATIRSRSKTTGSLLEALANLSDLTTHDGILYDSTMTGKELRAYIDAHVPDGPVLHLLHIETWKSQLDQFIQSCHT